MSRVVKQQRIERRISASLRILLALVLFLVQVALVVALAIFLQANIAFLYTALHILGLACAMKIFFKKRCPTYKFSWILLIMASPVVGLILYSLWGDNVEKNSLKMQAAPFKERKSARMRSEDAIAKMGRKLSSWERLARFCHKNDFMLYENTDALYFPDGAAYLWDLIDRMEKAEHYIFLEYFIIAEGKIWNQILQVLKKRAAHGVEVKVLFDDFGNIYRFSNAILQELQDAGIEVLAFNPVHQYVNRLKFNYRDHRKIAVIDGVAAYTGGVNIADEYANIIERFGHWKDTGICITGEAVWGFTSRFIEMWENNGGTMHNEHDYYRSQPVRCGEGFYQVFTDGPSNSEVRMSEEIYMQLIASARRFLYITTPYFAVEDSMLQALCTAADGGVDVRLMLPAIPDHKYTYLVAGSYYGELMRHGVKIYEYSPGFLHAKSVMVDREAALIGSTNMDYRSFQLHYECGVLVYDSPVVEYLFEDMDNIMEVSRRITYEEWEKRKWSRKVAEKFLRFFALWM